MITSDCLCWWLNENSSCFTVAELNELEQCCSPFACQDYDCNCEAGPAAYPSSRASFTEPSTTAAIEVG